MSSAVEVLVTEPGAEPAGGMPRQTPEIDPKAVTIADENQCFRIVQIRLPADCIYADLSAAGLWRRVQQDRGKALVKGDSLRLWSHDESFLVEAIVASAGSESVALAGLRRVAMEARVEVLAGDSNFDIVWTGSGYQLRRKSDMTLIGNVVATRGLAEIELRRQYGAPANGR